MFPDGAHGFARDDQGVPADESDLAERINAQTYGTP
jgi:hypothetical protein